MGNCTGLVPFRFVNLSPCNQLCVLRCLICLLCSAAKAANLAPSVITSPLGASSMLFMLRGFSGYDGLFLAQNTAIASVTYEPIVHANVSIVVACSFTSISRFIRNGSNFRGFNFQNVSYATPYKSAFGSHTLFIISVNDLNLLKSISSVILLPWFSFLCRCSSVFPVPRRFPQNPQFSLPP